MFVIASNIIVLNDLIMKDPELSFIYVLKGYTQSVRKFDVYHSC